MAFRPTVLCQIVRAGPLDQYGRPTDASSTPALCGVVKMRFDSAKTSIRTDAAATRGSARQVEAQIVLLFSPKTPVNLDDTIQIQGQRVRAIAVEPRFAVTGQLDHFEVTCDIWSAS